MFTEDYLMRIINQAIAALMTAIGLRKAGKYSEAQQVIQQAIEILTNLPANLIDQMDDGSILGMMTTQEHLDTGRLVLLADLYQEHGEILFKLAQPVQASIAFASALRFILEVALSEAANLSAENIDKVTVLVQRLEGCALPVETRLALSDYYQRLLEKDDQSLFAAGTSRKQVDQALAKIQDKLGSS
jgi:tetratricopeptide (TPR) repeat protein